MKPVGKFINLREEWELNYFLEKNGYRKTEDNRKVLIQIIKRKVKPCYHLSPLQNLEWEKLNEYYIKYKSDFSDLETKD
ncbi:hypothetical protein [Avibacterium paragallinarum]|uniref:hypothetical protein n=1 Tax=Avibacterium TaxID=292486 RepID=UPI002ED7787E